MKRKRGRPKGSTKKLHIDLTEETSAAGRSAEDGLKRGQETSKEEDREASSVSGNFVFILYTIYFILFNPLIDLFVHLVGSLFFHLIAQMSYI